MTSFRALKRAMRRDLHRELQVPALYLLGEADPVLVNVRVRTMFDAMAGFQAGALAVDRQDMKPNIRFHLAQVTPARGGIVSVEVGEAYRIETVQKPDDEFQTAFVVKLSAAEASGLPVPAADEGDYVPGLPDHPGMAVAGFHFVQEDASDEWVIEHGLGYFPVVEVFDTDGAQLTADVTNTDENTCVIHFVTPQSGSARCV